MRLRVKSSENAKPCVAAVAAPPAAADGLAIGRAGSPARMRNQPSLVHSTGSSSVCRPSVR